MALSKICDKCRYEFITFFFHLIIADEASKIALIAGGPVHKKNGERYRLLTNLG